MILKKKKKSDRQNPRTNGKENLYRQNHTQKHTHTQPQKEKKGKKYIYCCSQSPPPQVGMIHCLFRYSTDAGYIKVIVEI